ncbi:MULTISPECIES: FAD-binding oxidoreductase [unclassified Pseudomonas]|uniref:NAD(P)/FAD-dependent oxidoreductase n=1 Tax=unclassified Pseudomonas TaxID=196821 RepID=UPI0008BB6AF6|nr:MULTISPECIES: FAD-dependent oxidoreductase [unclassified Pseudomonas]SEO07846.1 Glycine/D-amino acid oxidase [Pseudomonas sp. NFACC39-1]SFG86075.1 Glycine/D-amino acid oxidase [Pseudomonas sp. NFACC45]
MHSDFEVAVIGGGIIGLTIAALLAERGVDTLLMEKSRCGYAGATAHTGGICRAFEPNPELARMAEVIGLAPGETEVESILSSHQTTTGALYRMPLSFSMARCEARVQGISPAAAAQLVGRPLAHDGAYYHEPSAAISDVHATMSGLRAALRKHGCLIEHCEVQRLVERNTQVEIHGLETVYRARLVINAAGSGSQVLSYIKDAQVRTIPYFKFRGPLVPQLPCIDYVASNYILALPGGLVQSSTVIRPSLSEIEGDPGYLRTMVEDCKQRLQDLLGNVDEYSLLSIDLATDLYTPDGLPRLGPQHPGSSIWLATGFNGVGYKYAFPIAARIYSQIARQR